MSEPMQYEVRDEKLEELLRQMGRKMKELMPPGYGFSLLIFGFHPRNDLFYISSAQREDMIRTIFLYLLKKGLPRQFRGETEPIKVQIEVFRLISGLSEFDALAAFAEIEDAGFTER